MAEIIQPPSTSASRASEWGAIIVSVIALVIFLAAIIVAWVTKDPSLGILLGMAGSNAATTTAYWLGSSSGSSRKTDFLASKPPP
jgi:hypothetical protein